jgi:hypothetical protein
MSNFPSTVPQLLFSYCAIIAAAFGIFVLFKVVGLA